jgi:hypothetical protein
MQRNMQISEQIAQVNFKSKAAKFEYNVTCAHVAITVLHILQQVRMQSDKKAPEDYQDNE